MRARSTAEKRRIVESLVQRQQHGAFCKEKRRNDGRCGASGW
jgi:hypothetical protein